jgi:uncharacterized membrane protein YeaQ/YmgE (transglycosylase-associated protein family)
MVASREVCMLHVIGFIIIGGIAAWLAGKIMSGKGYGVLVVSGGEA